MAAARFVFGATVAVVVVWSSPGAPLAQPAPVAATPTFTRDIAPIVSARCVPCHREGGAAPFPLTSFEDVSSRLGTVARVVETREMPPWLPTQGGETFAGARALNATERDSILRWIDQRAPRGEPVSESAPTAPGERDDADLVVQAAEPYRLAAEGPDRFRNFVLRVPIDRPRYVRAVTIRAGSTRVVHHASLGVDATRTARRFDAMDEEAGFDGMLTGGVQSPPGHFIGWAPGKSSQVSPPGLAWRLEPGVDLVLQVHMMPSGKPETVQPSLAFQFTDEAPRERAVLVRLGSTAIDIPPGARRHVVEDTFELPSDVRVLAISPHAHYLAREIASVATLPDGRQVPLITIAAWNFRWQDDYRYATPLVLPALTRITTRVTYDNSASNAAHPHAHSPAPNRRVVYGGGTADEMGDVWLQVVPATADGASRLERHLARRELDAQTRGYQLLASARPDDPLPRFTLATLYLQGGRVDEAVTELDKVCALRPSLVMAVYNRGVALQRAGRLAEAARDFRDALARDPRYAEAAHALGHVALAQRRPREAAQHFTTAVELWPEFSDAWSSLGTVRAALGAPDGAIDAYNRALAVVPEHREALNNLGILLARRGRIAEAIALLERAVAAYPEDAASRQNLAAARGLGK
jgi:Flp pilus assembly protein TadD